MHSKLATMKDTECSCVKCQDMCKRPCWGTPQEIQKIIDAGFGDRLMLDYWGHTDNGAETFIIAPAENGREKKKATFIPRSGCTFFKNGLCELHDLKLKPIEGRVADCKDDHSHMEPTVHEMVYKTWETPEGVDLVAKWMQTHQVEDEELNFLDVLDGLFSMVKERTNG